MKYDDFGRPIYETAEEYNRAHRGGVCPRGYDSAEDGYQQKANQNTHQYKSVAQRHATVQGSKNAKKIVLVIGTFVLAMNLGVIVTMFNMVGGSFGDIEYGEEEWVDVDNLGDGDESTPLPDGFEMFSYNGRDYSLPISYEVFVQEGFISDEGYEQHDLVPMEYEELLFNENEEDYTSTMIRVNNHTDGEIPMGKCSVDYFYVENPNVYDDSAEMVDFVFGDGLTFESSYEELELYFDVPSYHYSDHSDEEWLYDNYEWSYYGDDEMHYVSVIFINGVMESVGIEKQVYEENY